MQDSADNFTECGQGVCQTLNAVYTDETDIL